MKRKKPLVNALLCFMMLLGSMPATLAGAEDVQAELGTEDFSEQTIQVQAGNELETSIQNGLLAHLELDGDVTDETGKGTPTLVGSATYEQGINGQAIRFDGARASSNSNRIEISGREDLKFTENDTYSAGIWIKAAGAVVKDSNIMGTKSWDRAKNPGWCLAMNDGTFRFVPEKENGTEYRYTNTTLFTNSQWFYVVVTRTATSSKIYINGSQVSATSQALGSSSNASSDGAFCIGADFAAEYGPGNTVAFDDVRVWNRELSAEEIAYIYATTPDLSQVTISGNNQVDVSNGTEQQVTLSVTGTQAVGGTVTPQDTVEWQCDVNGVTIEPQGTGATAVVKVAGDTAPQTVQVQATCRGVTGTFNLEIIKDMTPTEAVIIGKRAILKTPLDTQETYSVEFRNQSGTALDGIACQWSIETDDNNGATISGSSTDRAVTVNIPGDAEAESTFTLKIQGAGFTETITTRLVNKGVIPANLTGKVENKLSFDDTYAVEEGGTITPTVSGGLTYSEGVQGKAGLFTNGNYVDLGNYDLAGKTITMAFQSMDFTAVQDPAILANKDWNQANEKGFLLAYCYNQPEQFRSRVGNGSANETITFDYNRGQWMTLAFTFEQDAYSIYMDGQLVERRALSDWDANWMNSDKYSLKLGNDGTGSYKFNSSAASEYHFLVDNFTIYNSILNQNELEEIAVVNTADAVPEEVIVHPLADVLDVDFSDGTVSDHSRYETEFIQAAGAVVEYDATLDRNVLSLSGEAATDVKYKVSTVQTGSISESFTFETAFLVNEKKNQTIAGNTEVAGMSYEMNSSGRVELWLYSATAGAYFNVGGVKPGFEVETGKYYHAVTTYDGTTLKIYLNGTEVYSQAASFTVKHPAAADSVAFSIGGDPRKNYADSNIPTNGKVARLGLYSTALTKKQVGELYREFQSPETLEVNSTAISGADSVAANLGTTHTFLLDFLAENGKYVRRTDRNNITWTLENAPEGVSIQGDATGSEAVDIMVDIDVANGASFTLKANYTGVTPALEASKTVQVTNDGTGNNIKIAVLSDFQLKSTTSSTVTNNIKTALQNYKAKGVDVILVPGDMTDDASLAGYQKMWAAFDAVWPDASTRPPIISCMGNHDYWNGRFQTPQVPNDLEAAKALYMEQMGVDSLNTHDVVKGYHFISISPQDDSTHGLFTEESIAYLENAIAEAEADDPTKPIFVQAHQHVRKKVDGVEYPTVYLSDEWGNAALYDAMKDHPQVVFFSGHSHAPIDDERSIHQEDFTSIGTSSMNYLELESGKVGGTKPTGYNTRAQSLYLEVTADEITVERWDKGVKMGSRPNWVIELPATKDNFAYTNEKRNAERVAPQFPSGAAITVSDLTENTVKLTLPAATHDDFVHSYRVEVVNKSNEDIPDVNYLYFSDFCKSVPNMASTVTYTLSGLAGSTDYEINIYAIESFGKESEPLSTEITTEKGTIDPNDPKPTADVLNVTFESGTGVDHSAFATELTPVTQSGGTDVSYSWDDSINYMVLNCNNSALKAALNSTQMAKITNQYSIETVVKLDNVNKIQSIFANTESAGISLEITSEGKIEMWARVGSDYQKIGDSENFILEAGRYYHLMGTYNGAQFALYVDGEKIATKTASGTITYKDLPTYIGGDTNSTGSIQAPIVGQIALARLYSIGLTEKQVTNIYNEYYETANAVYPVKATIAGPVSITVPDAETDTAQTADYTVSFQDSAGNTVTVSDTENITWRLEGADTGVSIPQDSTGDTVQLSVTNEAEKQDITLIAEYTVPNLAQTKITATIGIAVKLDTDEPDEPDEPDDPAELSKVEITGADTIRVSSQTQNVQYTATALDTNGTAIPDAEFEWTLLSSTVSGVGLNSYGVLYVNTSAGTGKVVIQAALKADSTIKAQKTISIVGNTSNNSSGGGTGGGRGTTSTSSGSGGVIVVDPDTNPLPNGNTTEYVGGFQDMPKTHWASESVQQLLAQGVIEGDPEGGMRPDINITREEAVKVLLLTLEKEIQQIDGSIDANTSEWAKDYMLTAKSLEVIEGDENGNLNGRDDISRVDAMVIIARALGAENGTVETLAAFNDGAEVPDYAKAAVAKLVELGIVEGYPDGSIGANQTITRAELFTLMVRIMK